MEGRAGQAGPAAADPEVSEVSASMGKKKPDLPAKQVEEVEDCQEAIRDPLSRGACATANGPNVPTRHGEEKREPSATGPARKITKIMLDSPWAPLESVLLRKLEPSGAVGGD